MTYFYKSHGTVVRKEGGNPPTSEYVAIDPKGVMRHIRSGELIEESLIAYPTDANTMDLKELYTDTVGKQLATDMLFPQLRKKKSTKPKSKRIPVKKCKCK